MELDSDVSKFVFLLVRGGAMGFSELCIFVACFSVTMLLVSLNPHDATCRLFLCGGSDLGAEVDLYSGGELSDSLLLDLKSGARIFPLISSCV